MNNKNIFQSALLAVLLLAAFQPADARVSKRAPAAAAANNPYTYVSHPVSTSNPAAQFAFDRGLTLVFAYQREEAEASFRQAAKLDPGLAMAWWGIGLAIGPDINAPPEAKTTLAGARALERARKLALKRSTEAERDYIEALAARYTLAPNPDLDALARAYRNSMEALVKKYPGDADARAMFAEAIMDQRPWRLWSPKREPAPDTLLLVQTIEDGLKQHPNHLGLLHYYIHAVEAGPTPEVALPAARHLAALPMEPAAAHLTHMPSHIFLQVGDWESAIRANEHSVHQSLDYRLSSDPQRELACPHCLDFLTYANTRAGNFEPALKAAETYREYLGDPGNVLAVLLQFGRHDEVLTHPEPASDIPADERNPHYMRGFWHYARGRALVATGRLDRAAAELALLRKEAALLPPMPVFDENVLDLANHFNKMVASSDQSVLQIADRVLEADLKERNGDVACAIALLEQAAVLQDNIQYGEPPAWFFPVRDYIATVRKRSL